MLQRMKPSGICCRGSRAGYGNGSSRYRSIYGREMAAGYQQDSCGSAGWQDCDHRREHEHQKIQKVEEADGFVASYTHMGGKIGVLVDVVTDVVNDEVKEMAKNVAMQIAALRPQYTNRSEVSEEYIAHEKEILLAQIMNDPKESQSRRR